MLQYGKHHNSPMHALVDRVPCSAVALISAGTAAVSYLLVAGEQLGCLATIVFPYVQKCAQGGAEVAWVVAKKTATHVPRFLSWAYRLLLAVSTYLGPCLVSSHNHFSKRRSRHKSEEAELPLAQKTYPVPRGRMAFVPLAAPGIGQYIAIERNGEFDEVLVAAILDTPTQELVCITSTTDSSALRWVIVRISMGAIYFPMNCSTALRVAPALPAGVVLNRIFDPPHAVVRTEFTLPEMMAFTEQARATFGEIKSTCRLGQIFVAGTMAQDLPTYKLYNPAMQAMGLPVLAFGAAVAIPADGGFAAGAPALEACFTSPPTRPQPQFIEIEPQSPQAKRW
jgi:hypothetical protein